MDKIAFVMLVGLFIPVTVSAADLDPMCRDQLPYGCWVTEDVIDNRIEHFAQTALMGMLQRGGQEAADASAILCAVKRGQIEGIYLPDRQVPAMRARAAGSNYWEMIPKGQASVCYTKQPGQGAKRAPLITFRKQIRNDSRQVANAISTAWQACEIQPTAPRCYQVTITKPGCDNIKWADIYYQCMGCDSEKYQVGGITIHSYNCPKSDELQKCEKQAGSIFFNCLDNECPGSLGIQQQECRTSDRAVAKCNEVFRKQRGMEAMSNCMTKYGDMPRHQRCQDQANAMASCKRQQY